ncbi:MAG: PBP1A family penicillin-binding protein [Candidatus Abyssobacteria bacterium SURF_17]|jgi:penicillin-binding protein 1A|uniref:PBP1A family penicillin-binding protein n=1 Tax=Candidatus Abyssobacteria bacterium SURF_17 TaxID=2093361 RepID=A0A419F8A5_9BACT|nr:MAG: PBP1A family penicillin-binding protein [Candidatus Abyssubacteria bacterium SURF_17]
MNPNNKKARESSSSRDESQQTPTKPAPVSAGKTSLKLRSLVFLVLAGGVFGAACGMALGLVRDLPQISNLENFKPMLSSVALSKDGEVIAEFGIEKRQRTSLSRTPLRLQQAVMAIEDQNFYRHFGIDLAGILRAAYKNVKAGGVVQGGSTITQQLARNLFLTRRRDFGRKVRESILALQIERKYTKEQILEMYLNQIYLGHGAYGVEQASQFYFGKHAESLSLAQCALLAALPKAPNKYSPKNNPEAALRRRNTVLEIMYDEGYITKEECVAAKFEPLVLAVSAVKSSPNAPYFAEYVRQYVIDRYGYDMLYKGGLQIVTTLDLKVQQVAETALEQGLRNYELQRTGRLPLGYADVEAEEGVPVLPDGISAVSGVVQVPKEMATDVVQGALVAIDPNSGEIRAMVGGRNFDQSEFNRAVQARRQPGSGFKPFVWATALESGMTASDRVVDAPVVYYFAGKVWEPKNYEEEFHGPTTLREALEHSRNIVSIKLLEHLGTAPVIKLAHRMGIKSSLQPNLSLALGSSGVTPLEITSAFATFAAYGVYREPISILKIMSPDGEVIEEKQPIERIALSEQVAYIMTTLMQGVIERGTGRAAKELRRPAAGKTGTTNDCTDAWFIGYAPQLATGVWVGYDDMRPLGEKQTGGRVAAPVWTNFMKAALADVPAEGFRIPPNIEFVDVEPNTGLLAPSGSADKLIQAFQRGTAPKRYYDPAEEERLLEELMHNYPTDMAL